MAREVQGGNVYAAKMYPGKAGPGRLFMYINVLRSLSAISLVRETCAIILRSETGTSEMAPKNTTTNGVLFEQDAKTEDFGLDTVPVRVARERELQLLWPNIIAYSSLHLAALYGIFLIFTDATPTWPTVAFVLTVGVFSGFGVTAGAHRLWTHRSYKAKWPLRLILIILNTFAFQSSVFIWARDHRMHHKYSETDADPHNATRGFFFSHMGWLMVRKHPEVLLKGKGLDVSDLYADPFVRFQYKYYMILAIPINFIILPAIPVYYWGELWSTAIFMVSFCRHIVLLNFTCLVNSAAHMWGNKPYDKYINPSENISVSILTLGEGYHNYHHAFPWDYKTAELGCLNLTTTFINFFSKIGWAYDLKTVSEDIIRERAKRTGDGSHTLWGWGDKDQPEEEIENATIVNKTDD